jgi:hypothetical protein
MFFATLHSVWDSTKGILASNYVTIFVAVSFVSCVKDKVNIEPGLNSVNYFFLFFFFWLGKCSTT